MGNWGDFTLLLGITTVITPVISGSGAHLVGIEVGWCWEGKVVPLIDYTRTGSGWLWQSFRGPVCDYGLLPPSWNLIASRHHWRRSCKTHVFYVFSGSSSLAQIAACGRAFWQTSWRFANSGPLGLQMCSRLLSPSKLASSNAHSLRWEMLDEYEGDGARKCNLYVVVMMMVVVVMMSTCEISCLTPDVWIMIYHLFWYMTLYALGYINEW